MIVADRLLIIRLQKKSLVRLYSYEIMCFHGKKKKKKKNYVFDHMREKNISFKS